MHDSPEALRMLAEAGADLDNHADLSNFPEGAQPPNLADAASTKPRVAAVLRDFGRVPTGRWSNVWSTDERRGPRVPKHPEL